MKKFYLLSLGLGLGVFSFAQEKSPALTKTFSANKPQTVTQAPGEKALGVAIWSDDFSSASGWTIDNNGITGAAYGWNIDAVDNSWYLSPLSAPASGGGYAEVNNGATPNQDEEIDVVYSMTTTNPINITALGGSEYLNLEFYQYGARFNDDQYVEISTDGTNFVRVYDNSEKEVLSASGGSAYPNPDFVQVNLTPYLSPSPGDIWIRFSWTTAFPGNTSLAAWITYGWQIDDVTLRTLSDNDIETSGLYYGSEGLYYHQIPEAQIYPIDFAVNAFNKGSQTQTGVVFTANETGGFTASSAPSTIASLDTTTLTAGPFTPTGQGSYSITFDMSNDSIDDVPGNNDLSGEGYDFSVGQFIYARDNNSNSGSYNFGGTDPFELGTLYDIYSTADLTGINVRLATTCATGIEIYGTIYDLSTGDFVFLDQTEPHIVEQGDLGTNLVLPFSSPVSVLAGSPYTTYMIVVGSFESGLAISTGGSSEPQTSFVYDIVADTWYYTTSTPYVRMNFDPTVSLASLTNDFAMTNPFPNPTNDFSTIQFNLENAMDFSIDIVNVTGEIVFSQDKGFASGNNEITFDVSNFASGVYQVVLTSENHSTTKKLVVRK